MKQPIPAGNTASLIRVKTYYWDFFGPNAASTATHFLKHLGEFLETNVIEGCIIDLTSAGDGHQAARCVAPEPAQNVIERSLRPKRTE